MKKDLIAEAYEYMLLNEQKNCIRVQDIPIADISHHHEVNLNEEMIDTWLNKGKKYDEPITKNVDIENKRDLHFNIGATQDRFTELANEHVGNLNIDHYHAVRAYVTGSLNGTDTTGSYHVNKHLIESHKNVTQPTTHFKLGDDDFQQDLHLHHLDDAINQNTHHEKFTTYSGLGFNPSHLMNEKGMIHLPAYTSSSTNKETALVYAKPDDEYEHHILQITHPKGSKGLYMGDNEDVTPFGQKEHLMPRNTTIKVHPTPEIYHDVNGTSINVWKAIRLKDKK